nr:response regulator [Gloeocapsa sp. PCC 7428]
MTPLQFLLLEDQPLDAERIRAALMDSSINHELLQVDTRADFVTALEAQPFNLILAAYPLLDFDGIAALEIAHHRCPETPFIFVSASLGEELAIDALKAGASNYVLKQRLERLVPAVQRALREAQEQQERKRSEQLLIEQKQLLETIATGQPLDDCLAAVCASLSRLTDQVRACFLLTDAQCSTFPRSVTPDLPPSFGQGLKDAPINDLYIGTCGEAVYRGQPITCVDIANDDRWSQEWRSLCLAHGILACHSRPVMGIKGLPLGSLMLCFDTVRMPTNWEYQLAEFGTQVASIAFEREHSVQQSYRVSLALHESRVALEQQAQKFDATLSTIADYVFSFDRNGRFLYANQVLLDLWGLTAAEAIGKTMADLNYPPTVEQQILNDMRRVFETGETIRNETSYINPAGVNGYFEYILSPVFAANGAVESVSGSSRNITDRKVAEEAMRLSEERYRLLTSILTSIVWTVDPEGAFVSPQPEWEAYTGQTWEEHQGFGWVQALHPDDREPLLARWLQAKQQQTLYYSEGRMWHAASREYRYFEARGVPLFNPDGSVREWIGNVSDIHDRKQAELALQESKARLAVELADTQQLQSISSQLIQEDNITLLYEQILDASIAIMHSDMGSVQLLYPERNELQLLAWRGLDPASAAFWQWVRLDSSSTCGVALLSGARVVVPDVETCEFMADTEDLAFYQLSGIRAVQSTPLLSRSGRIVGMISNHWTEVHQPSERELRLLDVIARQVADLIDRKSAEAEREQLLQREQAAREAAERANRVKDEFLAVLSHELRSPLNPILGWTRLLQNGKLDEARRTEALKTIERNAKLQTQLIEDLLDISRIMQGKLSLTAAPTSLAVVISAAIETVRLAAEAKNIQITLDLDPQIASISGDAARLQQVVWNLLTNAVKFTPNGGQVTVELRQLDHLAQIRVIDTGKGINPQFLPHVFEYFRQEDGSTTRKFGGLGLGLAIVRQIVELHGGTVWAESRGENQGATFIVQLPLLRNRESGAGSRESKVDSPLSTPHFPLTGLQILLVDDEPDTREFQAFLLEQSGAKVTVVASGLEALQSLDQFIPDAIVSDIGMADMDGYMLMQQIRSRPPSQGGQVPAIALTAYARDFDQQKARQVGFQTHITKPVEPEALVEAIASLLR